MRVRRGCSASPFRMGLLLMMGIGGACQGEDWVLGRGRSGSDAGGQAPADAGGQAPADAGAGDADPDGAALDGSIANCGTGDAVPADRISLLDRRVGFGRAVTGGLGGCVYRVNQLEDEGPGSLRNAVARITESGAPGWVIFEVSGEIELTKNLNLVSNLTLDGRGQQITLRNYGLQIGEGSSNILIENLALVGDPGNDGDAIGISDGANTIWIDHCALSSFGDGLVDVARGATDLTVSYSHFFDHDKVMLLGARPEDTQDTAIRVTLHHNWFEQTGTYHPRLRYGRVHSYNNLFDRWKSWASGSSQRGQLFSESNIYVAGEDTSATVVEIAEDPEPGYLRSLGDLQIDGAEVIENEPSQVWSPGDSYSYVAEPATQGLRELLPSLTGPER